MRRILQLTALLLATTSVATLNAKDKAKDRLLRMEQKAHQLISQMTAEEKISQLMNEAPGIPRLGIKPYNWWNEALHGVARDGRATVFPMPIALGATFDDGLIHDVGQAVSAEGRAKFAVAQRLENYASYAGLTYWAPNINIFRDPRWGRGMETYGEDPYLTGRLGAAYVRGLQGDDEVYLCVAACAKHFAVHSGPESTRHSADVNPSPRDLRETYLPAFQKLVEEAKVEAVMSAYNRLYGKSCTGSDLLLTDILRDEWHFKGHVVSDCGAVYDILHGHHLANTSAEAATIAIKAGLNLECGNSLNGLHAALEQQLISEADLDKALFPLMMTRLKLGILQPDDDCPYNNISEDTICCRQHRDIARRVAEESIVLLKNNDVLPLSKSLRKIFVCGPAATDTYYLMGNYYGLSPYYSTYLQGIMQKVSNGTTVNYGPGFNPSHPYIDPRGWTPWEARTSEVSIIFIGNNANTEGEEGDAFDSTSGGDRISLALPEPQLDFLRRLRQDNSHKIVTVITGGSPVEMAEIERLSDAVIMAWYPGQSGGEALGNLLFGDASFSGRLPITFPTGTDVLPDFDDYTMEGRTYKYQTQGIFYPFGYGLTYGNVSYAEPTCEKMRTKVSLTTTVTNSADHDADEVVQVYHAAPSSGKTSPVATLVAFQRVHVPAHSARTVAFDIPKEQLKTVQADGTSLLEGGLHTLTVGGAAPSERTKELGVSTAATQIKL
ncbi:MAG: glycoside hydrolase family 3 C-terminal domain-containing protein [Prevotella sp.]|nr:glycoside hydrolase family 3 C-terminal domain-containing protein [Prevotella sp.]